MILGSAGSLHPLPRRGSDLVHVLGDGCRTDERHRRDAVMLQQRVDDVFSAMDQIDDSVGKPRLDQ